MKPGDEIYVWVSTNKNGEDGIVVISDQNTGFEGTLASSNLLVAVTLKPIADKITEQTGYTCKLVRYERREPVPQELMEQTIELAANEGTSTATH